MTHIEIAPEVFDDFDHFFDYIAQFDVGSAPERIGEILEAVQILATSPMIGRPVKGGKREIVIGRAPVATWRCTDTWRPSTQSLCRPFEANANLGIKSSR